MAPSQHLTRTRNRQERPRAAAVTQQQDPRTRTEPTKRSDHARVPHRRIPVMDDVDRAPGCKSPHPIEGQHRPHAWLTSGKGWETCPGWNGGVQVGPDREQVDPDDVYLRSGDANRVEEIRLVEYVESWFPIWAQRFAS